MLNSTLVHAYCNKRGLRKSVSPKTKRNTPEIMNGAQQALISVRNIGMAVTLLRSALALSSGGSFWARGFHDDWNRACTEWHLSLSMMSGMSSNVNVRLLPVIIILEKRIPSYTVIVDYPMVSLSDPNDKRFACCHHCIGCCQCGLWKRQE